MLARSFGGHNSIFPLHRTGDLAIAMLNGLTEPQNTLGNVIRVSGQRRRVEVTGAGKATAFDRFDSSVDRRVGRRKYAMETSSPGHFPGGVLDHVRL